MTGRYFKVLTGLMCSVLKILHGESCESQEKRRLARARTPQAWKTTSDIPRMPPRVGGSVYELKKKKKKKIVQIIQCKPLTH